MDRKLKNIEDLFRKGLIENEEIPSSNVWSSIDKKLDKDNIISIKKKYKTLQQIAGVLFILVISLTVYQFASWKENKVTAFPDDNNLNKNAAKNFDSSMAFSRESTKGIKINEGLQKTDPVVQIENPITNKKLTNEKDHKKEGANAISKNNSKELVSNENLRSNTISKVAGGEDNSHSILHRLSPSPASDTLQQSGLVKNNDDKLNTSPNTLSNKGSYQSEIQNSIVAENDKNPDIAIGQSNGQEKLSIIKVNLAQNETSDIIKGLMDPIPQMRTEKPISKNAKINTLKQSRFSLTGFYSQNISFYHFENTEKNNSTNIDFEKKEDYSSSYSGGVLVEYAINKHWGIQSGLSLSTTNIDLAPETIYAQLDDLGDIRYEIITSSGSAYVLPSFIHNPRVGDSIFSVATTHTLKYLMIPLALKYNLTKGRFNMNARAGLAANFLTKANIETNVQAGSHHETESTEEFQGLRSFYVSGIAGAGIDFNLKKNLAVCFFPTYRFALSSINKDVPVKSFPNSLSFGFGLKMKL